jgi:hypothetical protein
MLCVNFFFLWSMLTCEKNVKWHTNFFVILLVNVDFESVEYSFRKYFICSLKLINSREKLFSVKFNLGRPTSLQFKSVLPVSNSYHFEKRYQSSVASYKYRIWHHFCRKNGEIHLRKVAAKQKKWVGICHSDVKFRHFFLGDKTLKTRTFIFE